MTVAALESKWTKASRVCLYLAALSVVLGCLWWIATSPVALHLDRGVWWPELGAAIGAALGFFMGTVWAVAGIICGLVGIRRQPGRSANVAVAYNLAVIVLSWLVWALASAILWNLTVTVSPVEETPTPRASEGADPGAGGRDGDGGRRR